MKNEQLYNETLDIILDAYNNRKLVSMNACGCFIGNIVAVKHKDFEPSIWNITGTYPWHPYWIIALGMHRAKQVDSGRRHDYDLGLAQIDSIGYTINEVNILEKAFEDGCKTIRFPNNQIMANRRTDDPEVQLAGMKSALIALAQIHETKAEDSLERLQVIHNKEVEVEDCAHI